MKIGNRVDDKDTGMPGLEIIVDGKTMFLSPFRGYHFQVSRTIDGVGDNGSSRVIGFGNIIAAHPPTARTISMSSIYASNHFWEGKDSVLTELLLGQTLIALAAVREQEDRVTNIPWDFETREVLRKFCGDVETWIREVIKQEQEQKDTTTTE